MSIHLNNFEVLIQLLTGSVLIPLLFLKENGVSKLRETYATALSIPNHDLVSEAEWKERIKTLRNSMMGVLIAYGCMVLYHCANYHIVRCFDQETKQFFYEEVSPSLTGIALLSLFVSVFQVVSIAKPICRMRNNCHWIYYLIAMTTVFVFYILLFPTRFCLNLSGIIGENWKLYGEAIWETFVNSWVLLNLLLWLLVYLKIYRRIKIISFQLEIDSLVYKQMGIEGRLQYILARINEEKEPFKKRYLSKKAKKELKKEESYFNENEIGEIITKLYTLTDNIQIQSLKIECPQNTIKNLKRIIGSSNLSKFQQRKLVRSIIKKPISKIELSCFKNINKKEVRLIEKKARKLCNIGVLVKTEYQKTWWQKTFLPFWRKCLAFLSCIKIKIEI